MKQLDPKAVWSFFINFVFGWFVLIIILSIGFIGASDLDFRDLGILGKFIWGKFEFIWVVIPAFLVLVLCFVGAKLIYHFYRYELTDAGFRKELGVISKQYVTIPYDRIQNVDIYRSLLDRILGLSSLSIQTAGMSGTGGSEAILPGLSREDAERLCDELIQRARQAKNQGL